MAEAPVPGAGEHQELLEAARRVLILKVRGIEYRLGLNNIPIQEKLIVRKATGLPYEAYIGDQMFGEDSVVVLFWLARRGAGEPLLTWNQACADWDAMGVDGEKDFEVILDDGKPDPADGDFPEASAPA